MHAEESQSWHRDHPYLARLAHQKRLTSETSGKDVRHIEIDLGDSGICYQPGDTLGVWISNDPQLADELLQLSNLQAEDKTEVDDKLISLHTLLTEVLEITQLHPGFIKHYAEAVKHSRLDELCSNPKAMREYIQGRQPVDVLKEFPASLSPAEFIACFRHMMPRQYSIASSQRKYPDSIHLTVGQVLYQQDEELRQGAGSVFLGSRAQIGQRIPVFTIDNPNFRMPQSGSTAMIMIGPGTGIAPFRAFLQERESSGATGDNWLLFGNPHRADDFLYQPELEQWLEQGLLTRLDLAFSRDQAEKRYVQHCLYEAAADVFAWLEKGAYLYVCGDAKRMAEDVQKTLLQIISEQGGMDANQARQYLVELRKQKRYQRDVY